MFCDKSSEVGRRSLVGRGDEDRRRDGGVVGDGDSGEGSRVIGLGDLAWSCDWAAGGGFQGVGGVQWRLRRSPQVGVGRNNGGGRGVRLEKCSNSTLGQIFPWSFLGLIIP
ncbi:hypothetical protein L484_022700 [Morus notabilis]|uniref:Uncharacterized protein n=1 Tax=Morus notabilis TaxID=981085 RepID=W9R5T4_9ROSA|nr:hypothetical protein L484_022700 [Morus notabilis]